MTPALTLTNGSSTNLTLAAATDDAAGLSRLPTEWQTIDRVMLDDTVIDQAVVGPNGVFAVSVDPDPVPATIEWDGLYRDGVRVTTTVKSALMAAHELRRRVGERLFAYPLLVTTIQATDEHLGRLGVDPQWPGRRSHLESRRSPAHPDAADGHHPGSARPHDIAIARPPGAPPAPPIRGGRSWIPVGDVTSGFTRLPSQCSDSSARESEPGSPPRSLASWAPRFWESLVSPQAITAPSWQVGDDGSDPESPPKAPDRCFPSTSAEPGHRCNDRYHRRQQGPTVAARFTSDVDRL